MVFQAEFGQSLLWAAWTSWMSCRASCRAGSPRPPWTSVWTRLVGWQGSTSCPGPSPLCCPLLVNSGGGGLPVAGVFPPGEEPEEAGRAEGRRAG